jgi:mediator of RNA polymerase II transcription subunit 8
LEPGVENWIYEHTTKQQAESQVNGAEKHEQAQQDKELRELWSWASQTSNSIVVPMMEEDGAFDDDYTIAEREAGVESVSTGLKRNLDRDSEEDDDEDEADETEGESMEGVQLGAGVSAKEEDGIDPSQAPMPLESVLRFMTTGILSSGSRPNR